jgi:hypothetical protein
MTSRSVASRGSNGSHYPDGLLGMHIDPSLMESFANEDQKAISYGIIDPDAGLCEFDQCAIFGELGLNDEEEGCKGNTSSPRRSHRSSATSRLAKYDEDNRSLGSKSAKSAHSAGALLNDRAPRAEKPAPKQLTAAERLAQFSETIAKVGSNGSLHGLASSKPATLNKRSKSTSGHISLGPAATPRGLSTSIQGSRSTTSDMIFCSSPVSGTSIVERRKFELAVRNLQSNPVTSKAAATQPHRPLPSCHTAPVRTSLSTQPHVPSLPSTHSRFTAPGRSCSAPFSPGAEAPQKALRRSRPEPIRQLKSSADWTLPLDSENAYLGRNGTEKTFGGGVPAEGVIPLMGQESMTNRGKATKGTSRSRPNESVNEDTKRSSSLGSFGRFRRHRNKESG